MNQYKENELGAYTIGGLDWEFGRYDITGAYYIKCLDYPGVRQTIWLADEDEAKNTADQFIEKFLQDNK